MDIIPVLLVKLVCASIKPRILSHIKELGTDSEVIKAFSESSLGIAGDKAEALVKKLFEKESSMTEKLTDTMKKEYLALADKEYDGKFSGAWDALLQDKSALETEENTVEALVAWKKSGQGTNSRIDRREIKQFVNEFYERSRQAIQKAPELEQYSTLQKLLDIAAEQQVSLKKIEENTADIAKKADIEQLRTIGEELLERTKPAPPPAAVPAESPANNASYQTLYDEPLFLDSEHCGISLRNLYVPPKVRCGGGEIAEDAILKWYNTPTPCLLLYGAAGIGKTSLVAKLIAEAAKRADFPEVRAVMLRQHKINMTELTSGEDILTTLFDAKLNTLKNKLLILDGLDEVCVLQQDFDGENFLKLLAKLGRGFHVIVTSRGSESGSEGCYFDHPQGLNGLKTIELEWTKDEVREWCRKYAVALEQYATDADAQQKKDWCGAFPAKYEKLDTEDARREIFCIPFILYLCCNSNLDLDKSGSVGAVYDNAFRTILMRRHIDGQDYIGAFEERDRIDNLVAWQYAKEIAYQMYLNDKLDLAEDSEPLQNAKSRTVTVVNERLKKLQKRQKLSADSLPIKEITEDDLKRLKFLAVFLFARTSGDGRRGIAFVHKTVYEYFTAVKLYEDYFAEFDTAYFERTPTDEAAEAVAESYIEAFRYDKIKPEIFEYLNQMDAPPFYGSNDIVFGGLDYPKFENAFAHGMKQDILARIAVAKPVIEYFVATITHLYQLRPINQQFCRAFHNFTWFLTGHGFQNTNKVGSCDNFSCLLVSSDITVNLQSWCLKHTLWNYVDLAYANLNDAHLESAHLWDGNLQGASLMDADLSKADLRNANLIGAHLDGADLTSAKLWDVNLRGATLLRTKLQEADLTGANLRGATLCGANLIGADLEDIRWNDGTDFEYATYCIEFDCLTRFPKDFNPQEHGMIEVNRHGMPVKKKDKR